MIYHLAAHGVKFKLLHFDYCNNWVPFALWAQNDWINHISEHNEGKGSSHSCIMGFILIWYGSVVSQKDRKETDMIIVTKWHWYISKYIQRIVVYWWLRCFSYELHSSDLLFSFSWLLKLGLHAAMSISIWNSISVHVKCTYASISVSISLSMTTNYSLRNIPKLAISVLVNAPIYCCNTPRNGWVMTFW